MHRILITGATGQIGSELTIALRNKYGVKNVLAADLSKPAENFNELSPYYQLEIRDKKALSEIVSVNRIDTIFHLASLLSSIAEDQPQLAWDINMNGLMNILEIARKQHCAVFFPSSIGAFGPETPALDTPQDAIQRPKSMYGITKVSGELLCDYYYQHFAVDTRGLRYPGLISYKTLPGGGTTDYAVDIFYAALREKHYDCFLKPDTQLDMMYMPDAIHAAMQLMETDSSQLQHRNAFNITAMNFTPEQLAAEIKKNIPDFTISYTIDPKRQAIADSWPRHFDDSAARNEWNWKAQYDLPLLVRDMLEKLAVKFT